MNGCSADGVAWGTTTTFTVDKPDGSFTEIVRYDSGRVTTTQRDDDGLVLAFFEAKIDATGVVTVCLTGPDGEVGTLSPQSVQSRTNSYGSMLEQLVYRGGTAVENTFDDDGNLRSVVLRGDWGEQTMEVRPDGGRTLHWETALHQGSQNWDAAGDLLHYELSCSDDSSYQWDLIEDEGRSITIDSQGHTEVTENAPSPVDRGRRA